MTEEERNEPKSKEEKNKKNRMKNMKWTRRQEEGFDFLVEARQTWSSQKTHKKILAQIISASLRMSESTTRWSLAQGSRGSVLRSELVSLLLSQVVLAAGLHDHMLLFPFSFPPLPCCCCCCCCCSSWLCSWSSWSTSWSSDTSASSSSCPSSAWPAPPPPGSFLCCPAFC